MRLELLSPLRRTSTRVHRIVVCDASLALLVIDGIGVNTPGFWDAEVCDNSTEELEGEEDPEDTAKTDGTLVLDVILLRPPVEANTGQDSTELSNGGAETVSKTTDTGWEHFTGNDEGGGIWSEVEEELGNDNAGESSSGANVSGTSKDTEHQGGDEETLDLNPPSAKQLNEGDGKEVTWDVTGDGNDQVTLSVLEEVLVWGLASGVSNISQNDRLVQVDTVKGDIDEEP